MKNISLWAKNHAIAARWLIFLICFLLNTLTFWSGVGLYVADFNLPNYFITSVCVVLILGTALYPQRGGYYHRKFFDGVLYLSVAFIWLGLGYQNACESANYEFSTNPTFQLVSSISKAYPEVKSEKKSLKKQWFQQIRKNLKTIKHYIKHTTTGKKTGLIILTIFAALLLTFLLIAISCSIACGGSDALAVLVFVGGFGLIVWGMVSIIKYVKRPA
jgi:hypothetical protein